MNRFVRNHQDFWAGIFFAACGGAALIISRGYPMGTASRMGPGYFPAVLGGALVVVGLIVALRALRRSGERVHAVITRPLALILASVLTFGAAMAMLGLMPAIVVLVVIASAAGREFRWREVAISAVVLCLLSVAIFVWGLSLPMPLFGPG